MEKLSSEYWSKRYEEGQTGWDLGEISPPLKAYIDQLENTDLKVLIPGCGNGYEGLYLWEQGFKNVYFADFSSIALHNIKVKNNKIPNSHFICRDFFGLSGNYDLILEQSMFCAIDPKFRIEYAKKTSSLLNNGGKLVGVFFDREFDSGPPFGGTTDEYYKYFKQYFTSVEFSKCYNSIEPRKGSEAFLIARK